MSSGDKSVFYTLGSGEGRPTSKSALLRFVASVCGRGCPCHFSRECGREWVNIASTKTATSRDGIYERLLMRDKNRKFIKNDDLIDVENKPISKLLLKESLIFSCHITFHNALRVL